MNLGIPSSLFRALCLGYKKPRWTGELWNINLGEKPRGTRGKAACCCTWPLSQFDDFMVHFNIARTHTYMHPRLVEAVQVKYTHSKASLALAGYSLAGRSSRRGSLEKKRTNKMEGLVGTKRREQQTTEVRVCDKCVIIFAAAAAR